ncbi:ABC transporter substrate-binding protein [Duganella fentianensis]|uniref:ABC transporter substrate-binding protein n=1 Tax=Duganella fentianensis TaxID=2692177 RepID=UPI0032B26BF9
MTRRPAWRSALLLSALLAALLPAASSMGAASGGEVEVLHFWTSGSEAGAVAELKSSLHRKGHVWKNFTVANGGGGLAMVMLASRVNSGNPPTAAQIKGAAIQEWAHRGGLSSIDDVARADHWNALLPHSVSETMQHNGRYVAAPLNVHRVNWLWIDAAALKKVNARPPTSWDEFFAVAEAMKKAGIIPVAHSSQSWLDMGTFESVAIGVGGAEFYQRAFVQLDAGALAGPQMVKTLNTYRRLKQYSGSQSSGQDWVASTAMLTHGKAGMLLMGDWAKAEMQAAGKRPGSDILCVAMPGTAQTFVFDIDALAMFQVNDKNKQAQRDLAHAVMDKDFQLAFNLAKGSIPVRQDVSLERFDDCARRASADFKASAKRGTLLPSLAHGMAQPAHTVARMWDVINQFWSNERMSADDAAARLAAVARQP